jgi:hypothetical protein
VHAEAGKDLFRWLVCSAMEKFENGFGKIKEGENPGVLITDTLSFGSERI